MRLTFLDVETGKVYPCDSDCGIWWWSEGNGGDDCNRAAFCDVDIEEERPDGALEHQSFCLGAKRLLAVEVRDVNFGAHFPAGEVESESWANGATYDLELLDYLNADYPPGHELVAAAWHGMLEPIS